MGKSIVDAQGHLNNNVTPLHTKVAISRRALVLLTVLWALTVLAVPVVSLISSKIVFGCYWITAFFCIVGFMLSMPFHHINGDLSRRWVHPALKCLFRASRITFLLMVFLYFTGFILLREGHPEIRDGIYVIWNHRVIREITREEYLRLCIVQRGQICSPLAFLSSMVLQIFCHADEIK